MYKRITYICIATITIVNFLNSTAFAVESPASSSKIWDKAPHSAFTDLTFFQGRFYCTFREGTGHVPGTKGKDGVIRVIASKDTKQWHSVALIEKAEFDLRDPKISVTPDGRLMVLMGGSNYDGRTNVERVPQVSFSDKEGNNFSNPVPIVFSEPVRSKWNWLWRVTWHKGTGYGVTYQTAGNDNKVALVQTTDGVKYQLVTWLDLTGKANEATVRFVDDEMLILIRREANNTHALFGRSKPPYNKWTWNDTGRRIGGPNFIVLDDKRLIVSGREYLKSGVQTSVYESDKNGKLNKLFHFKSGGDTSYPGLLVKDNTLHISFYSSHEGKTAIYFKSLPLNKLIPQ